MSEKGKENFSASASHFLYKVDVHTLILALGFVFQLSRLVFQVSGVVFQVITGAWIEVRELAANLLLGVNKKRRVFFFALPFPFTVCCLHHCLLSDSFQRAFRMVPTKN